MKFSLSWLHEHLATNAELDEILATMLKAGLEVEHVDNPAEKLKPFTVCKVREAEPHPDADKLRVCTVDTVDGEKTIVCGAPNARAGMSAIYAPMGTYIPGADFSLDKKPRKIRGVESHGMMCSAAELDAGQDSDGIIDLTEFFEVGTPAADALGLHDPVIDFEVTPNRPDWLGVSGIARDLAAAGAGRFIDNSAKRADGSGACPVEIKIEAEGACPVFAGAVIKGVTNGASPDWMQARLRAVGIEPKSLLVDVTNFISFDRARPLHVYDADTLQGPIVARLGNTGETLDALDGKTYKISEDMCVIADNSGAIGLGGVMGGESTAVTDATVNVFIESAWFDPLRTARTGRTTGIISDARYRFERGVDPLSVMDGLNLAIALILKFGGGSASKASVAGHAAAVEQKVTFHPKDVARLTGLDVKPADMKKMLKELGFSIEDAGDAWYLDVPSWRFDIDQSADIVEEIARLIGYDELPTTSLPEPASGRKSITTNMQSRVRNSRRVMAGRGFLETVTWSFMNAEQAQMFGGGSERLRVANPVASELNQMRPTVMANLASALQKGADHGETGLKLFEAGPIYLGDGPKDQRTVIAAAVRPVASRHWKGASEAYDAYAAKADLFAVLSALDQPPERFQTGAPNADFWHPGQAASLKLGPKVTVANFGALHPRALKALGIDGPVFGFELNLNALPQMRVKATKTKPVLARRELTPIRRDFAFVVDADKAAGDVARLAKAAEKKLISDVAIFDVYQGKGIDDGKKSVAIEITIQPQDKMKDADIQALADKVIASVKKGSGGVLRS